MSGIHFAADHPRYVIRCIGNEYELLGLCPSIAGDEVPFYVTLADGQTWSTPEQLAQIIADLRPNT